MKKVQMRKISKNNAMKNNPNLTSYLTPHTSHGITLMSLIIYMTIMFVILALIMRFTTYFTKNISDVADTTFEEEFEKFNMYMLQETKKTGNYVEEISEEQNSITFTDGNIIAFIKSEENQTGEIYFNSIKLCEGVDNCTFTSSDNEITNKTTITVTLTINGTTKPTQYVITNKINISQSTSTETNYIIEKTRLPTEYQEVEYIESTGMQYIDTMYYPYPNSTKIITELQLTNNSVATQGLLGTRFSYNDTSTTCNLFWNNASNRIRVDWIGSASTNSSALELDKDIEIVCTNNIVTINGTNYGGSVTKSSNKLSYSIYIGNFNNAGSPYTQGAYAKWKKFIIYENDELERDFVPCYRKSDNKPGLYDSVNNEFYTNQGTGEFIVGPEVD